MPTSAAFKSACWSALWAFIATFGVSLTGWLMDVTEWASDANNSVVFPDPSVLVKAAVAAAVAAGTGVVSFLIRFAQGKLGVGKVPVYVQAVKPGP